MKLPAVPFGLLFSIRSNLVRHRTLAVLTALAVCTSVALATALELASRGVEAQLEATATALAGAAEIEVTGGALGIPESLLGTIQEVPGVTAAVPYVQTRFRIAQDPGSALYVLGVDLLLDSDVRTYHVERGEVAIPDPLGLLADPRSVLLTRSLADRLGIAIGDSIAVARGSEEAALSVRGLLESEGAAEAFGGSIAVMDVYALQALLGRQGWLDRVDVVAADGADVPALMERIALAVGAKASVRRAAARDEWVDYTLATVRTLALSLTLVGAIIATLLVFGTISLSVDRRAREFALLRTVGLESSRARRLVRIDALVIAAAGTAVGLPLGLLTAHVFLRVLSQISDYLQDVAIEHATPTPLTFAVGLGVGLVVAHAGSFAPARRATARSPLVVLRGQDTLEQRGWPSPAWWIVHAVAGGAWLALAAHSFSLPPLLRVSLLFSAGIALLTSVIVSILAPALGRGKRALEILIPRIGRLAGASLTGRSRSSGTTLAAVAGVLTGLTTTLVLVESLAATFDDWIASEYRGAVLVTAGSPFQGRDRELVAAETTQRIRAVPGVRAVSELFTGDILFRGEEVLLVGQSMEVLERFGRLPAIGQDPAELARALAKGEIAVSDAFADHFGVATGDPLALNTPEGPQTFRVAGLFRDYVGPAGSVQLDIGVLDAFWDRDGSYLLAAWVQSPVESQIEAIRQAVGTRQDLFFVHGEALDRYAGDVLRELAGLLTRIAFLTSLLGGLAVVNLLLGSVNERRRELFLIRSVGATNRQLTALVLVDAGLVAIIGTASGLAVGVLCAYPVVTDVLREAFGWSVQFRVPIAELGLVAAGVVVFSLLACLYPAALVRRLPPREVFAPD